MSKVVRRVLGIERSVKIIVGGDKHIIPFKQKVAIKCSEDGKYCSGCMQHERIELETGHSIDTCLLFPTSDIFGERFAFPARKRVMRLRKCHEAELRDTTKVK